MELLGLGVVTIAFFVGFGLLIGVLFGFFGMGGSFLVTPVLLVLGYPATVAVGSGLAFVFGTSVIGSLRHRAHGQIDYKLAAVLIPGLTLGIEVGRRIVFLLDELGRADVAVGLVYAGLLGAAGLFVLRDARTDGTLVEPIGIATAVQAVDLPPTMTVSGGATVSGWIVLAVGLGIGTLSGCLGVGGGFLLLPVMIYGFGVPAAVAAGTSLLQIAVSGAFGTFVYALSNAVDDPVVAAMLVGSALGARVGVGATRLVDETDIRGYFAVVLLAGSVATASEQVGGAYGIEALATVSVVLIFGSTLLVGGAIVRASIASLERNA
ncbi:sulfite exporter TauE/SafE family protein [Natronorubrum sp. DTA7]|uniref:sulfite exporter TauE/SafE family protein n=1 Tax=Natronorubrum sp. DTA7 TaxID=3447016 RepID=UPI003F84E9FD